MRLAKFECYICGERVPTIEPAIEYKVKNLDVDICDICAIDIHDYAEQKRMERIYKDKREI